MNTKENKNNRILIVDDNPRNVEVVASLLSAGNYDFEFAGTGEEGLQWLDRKSFDLILMDVMMPGMNGYETCRIIKKREDYSEVPVIFLTAKTDTESLSKAFEAGGVDYVSKPFRPEELMARVATHLELKQRREELKQLNAQLEDKVKERTLKLEESNKKLTIALKDLQELDQVKTDFLHMVSHELRTPLNGIMGGISLIKDSEISEEVNEYFQILEESGKRLEAFSIQALNITQLQTKGSSALKRENFSLSDFLNSFKKEYAQDNKLPAGQIKIKSNTSGEIFADKEYVKEIFKILLDNSFRYAGKDKPVEIEINDADDTVKCIITDHGKGFPDKMLKPSMLNYTPGVEHQDKRTGLNLHFCTLTMHLHNGNLELSNVQNNGARVILTFPKKKI